ARYFATNDKEIQADEPEPAEGEGDGDYEAVARKRQMPLIAHRLNQANARLLLAFSWFHGTGPLPPAEGPGSTRTAARIFFKTAGSLDVAKGVHAYFPA